MHNALGAYSKYALASRSIFEMHNAPGACLNMLLEHCTFK